MNTENGLFEEFDEAEKVGCALFIATPFIQAAAIGFEIWRIASVEKTLANWGNIAIGVLVPTFVACVLYVANTYQMDRVAQFLNMTETN